MEGSTGGRRIADSPAGTTEGSGRWDLPICGTCNRYNIFEVVSTSEISVCQVYNCVWANWSLEQRVEWRALCLYYQQYSVIVTVIVSDLDEPENLEDIPEYEFHMKGVRVMRTNYSFLWPYLEPSRLLPMLVDKLLMTETAKKEAESYKQKFAQNSVILNQLFASDCPPLKLCDTLDVTGQEHIARKLLQGIQCISSIYQSESRVSTVYLWEVYSGKSLLQTPLRPKDLSWLEGVRISDMCWYEVGTCRAFWLTKVSLFQGCPLRGILLHIIGCMLYITT